MSSSDSGSDWEGEDVEVPCLCLFCDKEFEHGATAVLDHCTGEHSFHLMNFVADKGREYFIPIIFHSVSDHLENHQVEE